MTYLMSDLNLLAMIYSVSIFRCYSNERCERTRDTVSVSGCQGFLG